MVQLPFGSWISMGYASVISCRFYKKEPCIHSCIHIGYRRINAYCICYIPMIAIRRKCGKDELLSPVAHIIESEWDHCSFSTDMFISLFLFKSFICRYSWRPLILYWYDYIMNTFHALILASCRQLTIALLISVCVHIGVGLFSVYYIRSSALLVSLWKY